MRSRLELMHKMARMLRAHEQLLMNWLRVRGELANAAAQGLNNKCRVVTGRSYGLRTYKGVRLALHRAPGRLPEPEATHRFCSCRGGGNSRDVLHLTTEITLN